MITKSIGLSADILKRQAKKLRKELGIRHATALDQVAVKAGFISWKDFLKHADRPVPVRPLSVRPTSPFVPVLKYSDIYSGKVIGERPNATMAVSQHMVLGGLLKEIISLTAYHQRAYKPVNDILLQMDSWLGYEYDEQELPNEPFNKIYMGGRGWPEQAVPSLRQQALLKRKLRKAQAIIELSYHDCRPVKKLGERFELAFKALNKWPKSIKIPLFKERKKKLTPGTFVTKRGSKKLIMVFYHSLSNDLIEGYGDAGYFTAGRHEVTLVKEPIDIAAFKPLRLFLPYGKWNCADDTEVLFNRDYCPIWIRNSQGEVCSVDPSATFKNKDSIIYFEDRSAPYYYGNKKQLNESFTLLEEWGVRDLLPQVFNLIPQAIAAGDVGILSPKGFS